VGFTVADLLALEPVLHARPEVLAGVDLDRRAVRWIHTSEIYEIAPLLQGGEVLLTTGLGLVGSSSAALAAYVHSLAQRQVAALLLELGRTFPTPPAAMVAAAREWGLPLVALHGVVPFIQITETVHPLLVAAQLETRRRADAATARLHEALVADLGTADLVMLSADLCGGPAGLYARSGKLMAGVAVDTEDALRLEVPIDPPTTLAVAAPGEEGAPREEAAAIAALCARTLAVTLRAEQRVHRRAGAAELVRELASGRYVSAAEIASRAAAAGLVVSPHERAVALVVRLITTAPAASGRGAVTEAARAVLGGALVGKVDDDVVVMASVRPGQLRARLVDLAEHLDRELSATVGGQVLRLTAGPLVDDVAGLARSVPVAREAALLADNLGLASRLVLASDVGVYHLLANVVADAELERFITDQLGPLLELDARTGSELVATLDAYLEAGLSKTAAAAALGIRRQTMYARLERIRRALAGLDLTDRQRRTALDLALVSWRLRTAAASYRRQPRDRGLASRP
jgi:purine catabolism regulator